MLTFPNAKINIGLNITEKRPDGYHNIETIFYPVALCDVLETVESKTETSLTVCGIEIDAPIDKNLIYKAFQILKKDFDLPEQSIFLHKKIPFGAGLGGGSADAAFMLRMFNEIYNLKISKQKLENYAETLGSDCVFFLENKPCYATEKGTKLEPIDLDLSAYHIYLIKPNFSVNTAHAYSGVKPKHSVNKLTDLVQLPIVEWKNHIKNDFEETVFKIQPELHQIKQLFYENGALYASMSGSGSAVFGIFSEVPQKISKFDEYFTFIGKMTAVL